MDGQASRRLSIQTNACVDVWQFLWMVSERVARNELNLDESGAEAEFSRSDGTVERIHDGGIELGVGELEMRFMANSRSMADW